MSGDRPLLTSDDVDRHIEESMDMSLDDFEAALRRGVISLEDVQTLMLTLFAAHVESHR